MSYFSRMAAFFKFNPNHDELGRFTEGDGPDSDRQVFDAQKKNAKLRAELRDVNQQIEDVKARTEVAERALIDPDLMSSKLTAAALKYDDRQAKKAGYNRYALPQYLDAIDKVTEEVKAGASVKDAIKNNFTQSRLATALLRAVGEA